MLMVSVLPPFGRIDRIHSTLSAVARSVQSGVVCPSLSHGRTSSQTNIVSWSVLSDDNDLIIALIVSLGCLKSHMQFIVNLLLPKAFLLVLMKFMLQFPTFHFLV